MIRRSDGNYCDKAFGQALRNKRYIEKLLLEWIGDSDKVSLQRFSIKNPPPVGTCLVFAGWHVDYKSGFGSGVNLSNEQMVYNFVAKQLGRCKKLSAKEAADLNDVVDKHLRRKKAHLIEV